MTSKMEASTCVSYQAKTPKYNIFRRPTIFILYGFHSNQVGCFNKSESISNLYSMIIRKLNTTWLYRCVAIHSLAIRYANRQTLYRDAPVHRWIVAPLVIPGSVYSNTMVSILQRENDIWRYNSDYVYAKSMYFAFFTPILPKTTT